MRSQVFGQTLLASDCGKAGASAVNMSNEVNVSLGMVKEVLVITCNFWRLLTTALHRKEKELLWFFREKYLKALIHLWYEGRNHKAQFKRRCDHEKL